MLGGLLGKAAAEPVKAIGGVLDDLFTSDEERLEKKVVLERLAQKPHLAQIALNQAEAQHRSTFVAGWRPFIGWVCGLALLWHFMIYDFLVWGTAVMSLPQPPKLSGAQELISIVLALLGLGGLRTVEKARGVSK